MPLRAAIAANEKHRPYYALAVRFGKSNVFVLSQISAGINLGNTVPYLKSPLCIEGFYKRGC